MLMTEASIAPAKTGFARRPAAPQMSPLMLSDRLIGLAQDADRAGLRGPASLLVQLACDVLDAPIASHTHAA
jgi:hypothetical protein